MVACRGVAGWRNDYLEVFMYLIVLKIEEHIVLISKRKAKKNTCFYTTLALGPKNN